MLGVHVVDFTSFLPNRETDRPRLESTVRALARQRGVVVRSSPARDLATVLGRRPRPLGVRVAPSHPLRLAPAGALTAHFLSPAVVLARRRHDATRERDEPLDSTPTLEPAPLPCSGVRWGTLTTRWRTTGSVVAAQGQVGWLEARRSSGRNPASTEARAVRSPDAHGPFTGGLSSCHRRTEFARRNARRRAAGAGSVPR